MTGLDSNILIRYLAQDDARQSKAADDVMNSLSADEPGWVSQAAVLELVWVFKRHFKADRMLIASLLESLSRRGDIVIENSTIVRQALHLYRHGRADFGDCLIAISGRVAGCARTLTFDREAAESGGMTLIP